MIIELKLASKPGELTFNKRYYDRKSYNKMKYSENTQEMLKNGTLFLNDSYSTVDSLYQNQITNKDRSVRHLGYVINWGHDSIKVKIYPEYENEISNLNLSEYEAGMCYYGHIKMDKKGNTKVKCVAIESFALQNKNHIAYYSELKNKK